jgi:antirestriction protein ArdC
MEELVAELGAAFVCADLGINSMAKPDHAAYIQSWIKVLKGNHRAIFTAASMASRATEYLGAKQ